MRRAPIQLPGELQTLPSAGDPRGRKPRAGIKTLLGIIVGALVVASCALAYFSAQGSGSASGSVGSLSAPSISSITGGAESVSLSWTSVTPPGSGPVTYYVSRDGGAPSAACPSLAIPSTATSCTDTSVPAGSHTYTVTAVWRTWTATSAAKEATTTSGPTITSASPSSRGQGASGQTVKIVGTNFVSGAVASVSGTGVTVNSTMFTSATELTLNLSVAASASVGARNVTVTNPDEGTGTGTGVFTVNAAPTVESTSPSSRGQGASSQTIAIKGTGFVSGATSSFGSGVTVNSTTFKSSTELTANVTIAAGATPGARNVTVTNPDQGVDTGSEVFTVNAGPTVESSSPSSRGQGASKQTIVIKGANFVSGANATFGAGVTVESTSFVSSTELSAKVSVESGASTGAHTVTVTNPDAGVGSASAFTVNAKPTVTAASPNSRGQGASSQTIKITGSGFVNGATLAASFSGSGITVNSTSFVSATEVTANISIEAGASTSKRTITLTNGDAGVGTSGEIFTVNAKPTVTAASPNSRGQGASSQTIKITGSGFVNGATLAASFSGSGITVNSTSFVSATEVTANISIEAGASTSKRTITLTNPDEGTGTGTGVFTVNAAPTVESTSPSSRGQGASSQTIAIKGTGFVSGATSSFGSGVTVNSTTFKSSTELTANVTIAAGATPGARNVTVTNPDQGVDTGSEVFTVNAGPTVESSSPSSRGQGASKQTIVIKGANFVSGANATFGAGVTVESTSFVSSTELSAKVSVESGASTGAHTVTVTNPDAGVGSASAFTVNAKPTVTAASPNSRGQGASSQTIKITGSGFVNGATLAASFSGSGITVNSTSFVSATEVTANISIEAGASTSKRTITLTNGDAGVGTSGEIFTVNAAPNVESVSPSSGDVGGTENVTIKGSAFVSGATSSFGSGVTVNSTTFKSSTELTANVTIASGASTGTRTVTVTNPDTGVDTLANSFTVNPAPTVTSTSPSSRGQGASSQNVAIKGTSFESGAGLAASFSGTGITVNSTTFVSATEVTANITVAAGATTGARNVTLTNPDGTSATGTSVFTVNAGPTVESSSPSSRGQGASKQTIVIKGANFVSGANATFGAGVTVESTSFVSSTELSAKVSVESGASTGAHTVTVTNPDAGVGSASAFTVNAKPTVTAASPNSRGQGASSQTIKITGSGFVNGATLAASFSGSGITVNSTSFVSATEVTANISIEAGASTSKRTITLTNGDAGVGTSGEIFTVNAAPNVESVSPSSGDVGGTENVTIKGSAFVSGATSSFGSGVTVNSTTFKSSTELTANVTIASGASTGTRTVTVTNPDTGVDTLANSFTVNPAPTVTSTSPSSRGQGASSQNVAIKGTSFESGAGLAASFSGTGITVNSTTFVSATEVTANITVAAGATTGARNVTLTNPDGTSATGTSVFTVNAGPTITSPSKTSPVNPGHNGTTTFTMTGTSFVSGLAVTLSGGGTVTSFEWKSSTTITVAVTGSGGTGAKGNFTVTNPDGGTVTAIESFSNG